MSRIEIWKDIKGFEGLYRVSNTGKVKSCNRITICSDNKRHSVKERILKQTQNNKAEDSYLVVTLSKNGKGYKFLVHRLVAEAFVENPDSKETVNHIDGNKRNNFPDNLEWTTLEENIYHAIRTGLANLRSCEKPVICVDTHEMFPSICTAAKKMNVDASCVSNVCNGKSRTAKGHIFSFIA